MKKLVNLFYAIIISFVLILSPAANAGEIMEEGAVLTEQSYVFSIDEAKRLMERLDTLEQENERLNDLVLEYKALDDLQQKQIGELSGLLDTKDMLVLEYDRRHDLDLKRMKQLERQATFSKAERWAFMGAGIGITIGAILIADKLDDGIERNSAPAATGSATARTVPLFRF